MNTTAPIATRARRGKPGPRYDTPDENDELLHEEVAAHAEVVRRLNQRSIIQSTSITPTRREQPQLRHQGSNLSITNDGVVYRTAGYPTPSPQQYRHSAFPGYIGSRAVDVSKGRRKDDVQQPKWPTPPYEDQDHEWVSAITTYTQVGLEPKR